MQVTIRLTEVMSKRLQVLLDRGLTKTHVLHEALDRYLPLEEDVSVEKKLPPKANNSGRSKNRKRR